LTFHKNFGAGRKRQAPLQKPKCQKHSQGDRRGWSATSHSIMDSYIPTRVASKYLSHKWIQRLIVLQMQQRYTSRLRRHHDQHWANE
jgi:hypothetical protein